MRRINRKNVGDSLGHLDSSRAQAMKNNSQTQSLPEIFVEPEIIPQDVHVFAFECEHTSSANEPCVLKKHTLKEPTSREMQNKAIGYKTEAEQNENMEI